MMKFQANTGVVDSVLMHIFPLLSVLYIAGFFQGCVTMPQEFTDDTANQPTNSGTIKNNRYHSKNGEFSIDLPAFLSAKNSVLSDFIRPDQGGRVVVNFGPMLPDTTLFTIQIADQESYSWYTTLGQYFLFGGDNGEIVRDDLTRDFYRAVLNSTNKTRTVDFKELVFEYFSQHNTNVTYAVYEQRSKTSRVVDDDGATQNVIGVRLHAFYLLKSNNKGVFVWLQIPINNRSQKELTISQIVGRQWAVQNNFFSSLQVN